MAKNPIRPITSPTNKQNEQGLEELVGRGRVQRVDQVGEHQGHQHQDVRDSQVDWCACGESITRQVHMLVLQTTAEHEEEYAVLYEAATCGK